MQFAHNGYYKGSTPLGLKPLLILLFPPLEYLLFKYPYSQLKRYLKVGLS
jgi:hypothetical protein